MCISTTPDLGFPPCPFTCSSPVPANALPIPATTAPTLLPFRAHTHCAPQAAPHLWDEATAGHSVEAELAHVGGLSALSPPTYWKKLNVNLSSSWLPALGESHARCPASDLLQVASASSSLHGRAAHKRKEPKSTLLGDALCQNSAGSQSSRVQGKHRWHANYTLRQER